MSGQPAGWVQTSLGEVVQSMKNGLYKPADAYADDGIVCLRMYNIDSGQLVLRDLKRMRLLEEEFTEYQLLPGDLLVNRVNSRELVGKTTVIPPSLGAAVFESKNIRLRLHSDVAESRFISYQLLLGGSQYFAGNAQQVVGMASISQSQISRFPISIAPRNEQVRIVSKIDELFSDLDAGVAALERARANLKRYRAAVLKAAVEGKLTEQWRKEHPDVEPASKLLERILAERRKKWEEAQLAKYAAAGKTPPSGWKEKYAEPAKPATADLPDLPEGWCWASVEQCASFEANAITDGPFGSNLKTAHYTDSGPRVIRLQNIGDGYFADEQAHISQSHFLSLQKHAVNAGDLVIALLGEELPRACIVPDWVPPAIVKADCVRFRPNNELAQTGYLNAALNAQPIRELATLRVKGVGRPRLNLSSIREIALPLPPMEEQRQIAALVAERISIQEQTEKELSIAIGHASKLRQAILKRAFEGKLVSQDPNDEPASVLLERIRAARAAAPPARNGRGKRTRAA